MCGDMGKAVLRALTGALLCGMVSDAAYLQHYEPQFQYEKDLYYERPYQKPLREAEKPQDLRNVPGAPGVDYPIYHEVPETRFSCAHVPVHPGMYANVETGCQAYHVCHDGREGHQGASFLCTNGTLFDQTKFACDWWYNVDCSQAIEHYKLNADPEKNPYVPKKKAEDDHLEPNHKVPYHGPQGSISHHHGNFGNHGNLAQHHGNLVQHHGNLAHHANLDNHGNHGNHGNLGNHGNYAQFVSAPQRHHVQQHNDDDYGIYYRRL